MKRRRLSASDRREAILEAAIDVFSVGGFAGTTLEEVAVRAGVSKALIYEHFSSKEELIDELVGAYGGRLIGDISEAVAKAGAGEERLRAGVAALLDFVAAFPQGWRLVFRNAHHPGVAEGYERLHEAGAAIVAGLLASEAPRERTREAGFTLQIEATAQQIIGAIDSLAGWWVDHPEMTRDEVLGVAMDFCWLGLERIAAGERWATLDKNDIFVK